MKTKDVPCKDWTYSKVWAGCSNEERDTLCHV